MLLPVAAAKAAGFTKVVTAPGTSTSTGVTGCPYGAREEFENASGTLGLESEVLYCESAADSNTILKGLASGGEAKAGLRPPKNLGSTAIERLGSNSTYLIAWRRGTAFELTGLSTDLSSSSTTSTTSGDRGSAYRARPAGAGASGDPTGRAILECDGSPRERAGQRLMRRRKPPQTQLRWRPAVRRIPQQS